MKICFMLMCLVLSMTAMANECVVKRGLVNRLTGLTVLEADPYRKGDTFGATVLRVQAETESRGKLVREETKHLLVETSPRTEVFVERQRKEIFGYTLPFDTMFDVIKLDITEAKYEMKVTEVETVVEGVYTSKEDLAKRYKTVSCDA